MALPLHTSAALPGALTQFLPFSFVFFTLQVWKDLQQPPSRLPRRVPFLGMQSLSITGMREGVAAGQAKSGCRSGAGLTFRLDYLHFGGYCYAPKETCQGCHEISRPVGKEVTCWL